MTAKEVRIGVLALQGAFQEHVECLRRIPGVAACEVRRAEQLSQLDGLVIPGGESTTMGLVAERWGLVEPLRQWVRAGRPVWGTCAGMILLSDRVAGQKEGAQPLVGGLHVTAHRNFFGSQLQSFEATLSTRVPPEHAASSVLASRPAPADQTHVCRGLFIRAPALLEVDADVTVLAAMRAKPHPGAGLDWEGEREVVVAAMQGPLLATAFHPELTPDLRWHELFVGMVAAAVAAGARPAAGPEAGPEAGSDESR